MTLRQHLLVGALFLVGMILGHTEHQGAAVLTMAVACLAVLVLERGEW